MEKITDLDLTQNPTAPPLEPVETDVDKFSLHKFNAYKQIIRRLVEEVARMAPSDEQVETQLIIDEERGHYLLFSVGWEAKQREYTPFLHLDVKPDGQVWLQHDGTDLKIALLLIERGVAQKDIVLAFQNPYRRQLMATMVWR